MNKRTLAVAAFVALAGSATTVRSNDYTNRAQGQQEEIQKDRLKAASAVQKQEYWKEWMDFAQKQYTKALKQYGPDNELTEDAKKRHAKAVESYDDARKGAADAKQELREDLKK